MYEINILENDEFDALPYKHAKTALGMADAATGKAYIRRTGIEALDANTIRHEFDELLQSVSPHEEDGIRYKSGGSLGKWLGPILGTISSFFVGPVGGAAIGAGITGGTGAHSRSVKPEKYGKNTFGNVLTDAAIGAAGSYGGYSLGKGAIAGGKAAAPGFFSKLGGIAKGAAGIGTGAAPTAKPIGAAAGAAGAGVGGPSAVGAGVGGGAVGAGVGAAATPLSGITGSALGAGALKAIKGAGKNLGFNSLVSSLAPPQSTAISGVGNYGGQGNAGNFTGGNSNVLGIFGNKPGSATQGEFKAPFSQEDFDQGVARINQTSTRQTGSVFDQFRAAQPGQTVEGSSAFANQLAAVEQGNTQNIGSFTQQTNDANTQAYNQYRYDGVKNANGLTDSKMTEYINLSRQPDSVIKAQFPGMTPQAFRAIFDGLDLYGAASSGKMNAEMDAYSRDYIREQSLPGLPPDPEGIKTYHPNIG